ncbi:MAG: hypothetical protein KKD17_00425 [Nanoarchaeota archaeon]|nr:hypothetical protein [Nanoarchaeota archaeon]
MSVVHDDCPEDVAELESIAALNFVKWENGGCCADVHTLLSKLGNDAMYAAINRGWLDRQGDVVVVTDKGERAYRQNEDDCNRPEILTDYVHDHKWRD